MAKEEWRLFKPIDVPIEDESINGLFNAYIKGRKDGQKELLKYLIKLAGQYSMPNSYSLGIPIDELESMLRKLEATK